MKTLVAMTLFGLLAGGAEQPPQSCDLLFKHNNETLANFSDKLSAIVTQCTPLNCDNNYPQCADRLRILMADEEMKHVQFLENQEALQCTNQSIHDWYQEEIKNTTKYSRKYNRKCPNTFNEIMLPLTLLGIPFSVLACALGSSNYYPIIMGHRPIFLSTIHIDKGNS